MGGYKHAAPSLVVVASQNPLVKGIPDAQSSKDSKDSVRNSQRKQAGLAHCFPCRLPTQLTLEFLKSS